MKKIIITLLLCFGFGFNLYSQNKNVSKTGTTAGTFLEIPIGAKATSLGGAYVSVSGDATSLFWNPAGVANLVQNELVVSHTEWLASTKMDYAALVIPISGLGNLGLSFTSLSMPDMKVTTVDQPDGTGEFFSASDLAVGLSYSRSLTDRFSIGATAKFIQEKIWHETAIGFAFDAGTSFRTDLLNGLVIGASISNFGSSMQMTGRDTRLFGRVDNSKEGSNDQIPFDIQTDSWDLPLSIQLGVSTYMINNNDVKWLVALDAVHPNNDYESVNFGTQVNYQDILSLRAGYNAFNNLFPVKKLADTFKEEGGLSLGIGINSSNLLGDMQVCFDYAYRDFGRLESIHTFSVGIKF